MNKSEDSKVRPEAPLRVLLIAASQRRQYNCPGIDGKARSLLLRMREQLPKHWEIDVEDISNVYGRQKIQSCNACVSTSMALCVWPCNCYEKNHDKEPDLMWDLDFYSRLDHADAWAFIAPTNWYAPTSNLKLFFDRLVCANGGNPIEARIDHKNPELAMKFDKTEEFKELSQNHLEGRTAAFFSYGDAGGDEIGSDGIPKLIRHKEYFDAKKEIFDVNTRDAYAPLVWQCRYGGIEVPDPLWRYAETGKGKKYSENQAEDMIDDRAFLNSFDTWVTQFSEFVSQKGKVIPSAFSARDKVWPSHRWADAKLGLRTAKMMLGGGPADSSPAKQDDLHLNQDRTFTPKKSLND
ncbi:MAG: flavodoxin family protein [Bdellovibrionales bacterium]|nr:flavodoxin family protein [Oligoflexia bacterium]